MNIFDIGDRVEIRSCVGFPGTLTSFVRGRVQIRFDDCADSLKVRVDSVQGCRESSQVITVSVHGE